MITQTRKTGNLGEDVACKFLVKHNFVIIGRNYLRKCGEIDIIAKKQGITHFIEVKTLSVLDVSRVTNFRPEENVHPRKLQKLRRVIQVYLNDKYVSHETDWMFDIITVLLDREGKKAKVTFMENIIL